MGRRSFSQRRGVAKRRLCATLTQYAGPYSRLLRAAWRLSAVLGRLGLCYGEKILLPTAQSRLGFRLSHAQC
jgi:hypothetical protein